ncbi:uncharacterized protein METZ01_LOCUS272551, partial [marine metagenome]
DRSGRARPIWQNGGAPGNGNRFCRHKGRGLKESYSRHGTLRYRQGILRL